MESESLNVETGEVNDVPNSTGNYVEDVFATAAQIRRHKRRYYAGMENNPPRSGEPMEDFMEAFRVQRPDFVLTPEQIEWFYPKSKTQEDFDFTKEALAPNVIHEQNQLRRLVPPITPADDYFEPEELDALIGKDQPLRAPTRHLISKLLF